jgi:hypothetical protein
MRASLFLFVLATAGCGSNAVSTNATSSDAGTSGDTGADVDAKTPLHDAAAPPDVLGDADSGRTASDGGLPVCPASVYGPPSYADAGCEAGVECQATGCHACAEGVFEILDGMIGGICSPDHYWVPDDTDCFPMPGYCAGLYSDDSCTTPLVCGDAG